MSLLPRDRFQRAAFAFFVLFLFASCLAPPYPDYLLMQHAPTVLAAGVLPYFANRFAISRFSFASIIVFLCLHTLGARYLYTYTPYDAWCEKLFGFSVNHALGFERNHYDRLVHFSYGLLIAIPIQEFERRHLRLSAVLSSFLAVECILATSAAYELVEWWVTIIFAPDWADQFLGQQGDMFDAQKDMSLATAGAILSMGALALVNCRRRRKRIP
jgi:putative membrane protein